MSIVAMQIFSAGTGVVCQHTGLGSMRCGGVPARLTMHGSSRQRAIPRLRGDAWAARIFQGIGIGLVD
jgi:hypothetical protein